MAKLSTKHSTMESLVFSDFSGGLNLTKPPEIIDSNEMQEALNFEFSPDSGLFKLRAGLSPVVKTQSVIRDMFPMAGTDSVIIRLVDNRIYVLSGSELTYLGTVTGDGPGSFDYWGDGQGVIMAFGASLYTYEASAGVFGTITTEDAPTAASLVFYRQGRVAVIETGSDSIRYSGVGDPSLWIDVPTDDSTAKSIEVGYKDGCEIVALGELGGDLLVFKAPIGQPEHGRVYQVIGEYPSWSIKLYSKGLSAWNSSVVKVLGNDLIFLTKTGLASLRTTAAYGNFSLFWPGAKVNPRLSLELTSNSKIAVVTTRGQLWVWDNASKDVYVLHYQVGEGAWTKLRFNQPVQDIAVVSGKTYVAIDNTVFSMEETNYADFDYTEDDVYIVNDIVALWKPGTIVRRNQLLTKMVLGNYLATPTSNALLYVEGLKVSLLSNTGSYGDIAATDTDIAKLDDDKLSEYRTSLVIKRCQFVKRNITPEVHVTNGTFYMTSIALEVTEV